MKRLFNDFLSLLLLLYILFKKLWLKECACLSDKYCKLSINCDVSISFLFHYYITNEMIESCLEEPYSIFLKTKKKSNLLKETKSLIVSTTAQGKRVSGSLMMLKRVRHTKILSAVSTSSGLINM